MSANEKALRIATRTDVGRRRKKNEDYFTVHDTPNGMLVVVHRQYDNFGLGAVPQNFRGGLDTV